MLRNQNLLTAGLTILLAVSGQAVTLAGGHGGGGGGSFHGASHSVGNAMSHQSNMTRTPQFQTKQVNNVVQSNKLNVVPPSKLNNVQVGKMTNLQTHTAQTNNVQNHNVKLTDQVKNHLPVSPVNNSSSQTMKGFKFSGNVNMSKGNSIFPIKSTCAPFGGGYGKCGYGGCWGNGYGGCWGNGCGFGWGYGNYGCGNWGYGNSYGCGYWPGYFGGCYNYAIAQPYPVQASTPVDVSSTAAVTPGATSVVLNDTAVPPLPPVPESPSPSSSGSPSPSSSLSPSGPGSAKTREIDLAVKDVRVVEAATANLGALYRVSIINQGPANLDVPTRVAALGIKDGQPSEDTPRTIEMLKSLKSGETAELDLRLPVAANALPRLLVAVEIPESYKDTNEMNNVAAGEVAQVPPLAVASK